MASTDFTQELLLGTEELDAQHREIFDRLVEAERAARGEAAEARVAMAALYEAVTRHLSAEEALMEETAFVERARHKTAHDLFLVDLGQLRAELDEKGPTPLVGEWLRYRLPEWLRFHIQVNDSKLAEHLRARRAKPASARPRSTPRA